MNDDSGVIFDELCTSSDIHPVTTNSITLEHHIFNELHQTWQRKNSASQPTLKLHVRADPLDVKNLGFQTNITYATPNVPYPAVTDTGCQSCLSGVDLLYKIGLNRSHLIPVSMKMKAANNEGINIMGALPLQISGVTPPGETIITHQLVYFSDQTNRLFLSKQACLSLGIISEKFPTVGETLTTIDTPATPEKSTPKECQCPPREQPPPAPKSLPFPPTEDNVENLQNWLLDYYKTSTFNTCEHQTLPMMSGPPLRLMIDPAAKPVAKHKPIPIPIHWQQQVYAGLDQDCKLGVIEPVPVGTPVTWCHKMIIIAKKSGKPRRTVNMQALNDHAVRETHHTQSPYHQARSVPPNTYKTIFDCWHGYHSVLLHEDDRHLTTFITPKGRYRYKVAPQGYIASGDGYTRRFDEIVADFPRKTKCIDDSLLWSNTIEDAFYHAVDWLDLCGRNGIILNPSKFDFCKTTVTFAGFEISPTTVRPCPQQLEAIKNFPKPQNITDVRSWFGLINQVAYAFASAEHMLPFRNLLKPSTPFEWSEELDKLFEESKTTIINEIHRGVEIFDKEKPTCLATDWSKDGVGFWLFQQHCSCKTTKPFCCKDGWKITLVGSRFTSSTESRYAPIEGEALAVVEALKKARHFVLGCKHLVVATDHKPLLKVFSDRSLEDISNTRLVNLKEKTLQYRFQMIHIPGVKHAAADCLSRHPVSKAEHITLPDDIAVAEESIQPALPQTSLFLSKIRTHDRTHPEICYQSSIPTEIIKSVTWDDIRVATNSDQLMSLLIQTIEEGFPEHRNSLHPDLRLYHQYREALTTYDGVILYRDRVVIPPSLRNRVLTALHAAHQCITQMCSRAESSFFWPGMTPAITNLRVDCSHCNRIAPSQPHQPPTPPILPAYPFQCVCSDYFHYLGKNYLIVVDRYSSWPIVEQAAEGAKGLITALRRTFVTFGISEELSSDGGTEYTANATQTFLNNWGVHHRLSSVSNPHSNCRAEVGVKTAKRMIMENTGPNGTLDTDKFMRAMLQYRNTPDRDTGLSPAMAVFGRSIRDFIPVHPGRYLPHPTWRETLVSREEALRNRHFKVSERLTEHTRTLPPLVVGDHVRIQNQRGNHPTKWDRTGVVVEVRQYDQYVIRVDGSGRVTLRNRRYLRKHIPVIQREPLIMMPGPTSVTKPQPLPEKQTPQPTPTETDSRGDMNNKTPTADIATKPPQDIHDSNTPNILPADPTNADPPPVMPPPEEPIEVNRRTPLLLRQLQSHNKPGLMENTVTPSTDKRVTRQSTRKK